MRRGAVGGCGAWGEACLLPALSPGTRFPEPLRGPAGDGTPRRAAPLRGCGATLRGCGATLRGRSASTAPSGQGGVYLDIDESTF